MLVTFFQECQIILAYFAIKNKHCFVYGFAFVNTDIILEVPVEDC